MKNVKRIFTLIMVLAMVLTLAVPAMAEETVAPAETAKTYTITLNHPGKNSEHTYLAYQIFTGTLSINANGDEVLSSIEWGTGVTEENAANIITGLQAESALFGEAKDAQTVADVLSANTDKTAVINAFRHIVGKNLNGTPVQAAAGENGVYTWADMGAGYYLIMDKDDSLEDTEETATNYILQVVGDTEIQPKGGKVSHDKAIVDGGEFEAVDFSIGDAITFKLTGTLPANYADFETFEYKFVDTLSKGLSFNNDVKVYLENAGTTLELTSGFEVNAENPTETGASFTVDFEDLKDITDRTIDSHTTIIVEYTATLNENAKIGAEGNTNTSYIVFSNDPHGSGNGQTTKDEVYVFTFELDVNKVNGNGDKLANAEFVLYRKLSGKDWYAQVDAETGVLTGWIDEITDANKASVTLKSDEKGLFIVKGLEADTYYLRETKAPEGYNLREEDMTVDITAEVAEVADSESDVGTKGAVTSLQIKVDTGNYADGNKDTGIVSMNVINNPGATLPETGGVGTTLFYAFGGIMVVAAIVLLMTKKRMNADN